MRVSLKIQNLLNSSIHSYSFEMQAPVVAQQSETVSVKKALCVI